jgi:type VI protein secretion system component Hcp
MGLSPYIKLLGQPYVGQKHSVASETVVSDTDELDEVSFTFQKIDVANIGGGTSSQDDWDTGSGTGGGSTPKSKHKAHLDTYAYQAETPFDIATGQASGKRRWSPLQRKGMLVLPASSVLTPQLKQAYVSQTTIASIVMSWGPFGRDKLRLANVHVMNFVPHGGHSGQVGDYIAFDVLADLLGTVAA